MEEYNQLDKTIDPRRNRYPFCIVWTPLPCITAILPFIGHTGICDSEGVIHDFSGPYSITIDDFAFGDPTKYTQLKPSKAELYEQALAEGDE